MSAFLGGGSSPSSEPSPTGDDGPGEACIANISPRKRRERLLGGVVASAAGLAVLAALMLLGWDRLWRLATLPLFWGAASGFFQWREKT
jgi:hypothetical protein